MNSPIFESFFQNRAKSGSNDLCINLYAEHTDGAKGPEIGLLIDRGGLVLLTTVGTGPIRGEYVANDGNLYLVSGNGFYQVTSSYSATLLGNVASSSGPVSMIDSPTQVLVVDGMGGWCYELGTESYTQVIPNSTTSDTGPNVAVYQDGFGIVNSANSNIIYQSNYNDLSTFATLNGPGLGSTANDAYIQQNPQNVVTMYDLKEEVWIFKQKSIEVWINEGNPGFAFQQLQGVSIPFGCCAPASVCKLGSSLVWMGSDEQGDGVVYMSNGYNAVPISTHALSAFFQSENFVLSNAIAYSYQRDMHYFYVLTFPTQNITYVYDLSTKKWHQRASFLNGQFNRELPNCHALFNSQNVVGDYQNGNLYALVDDVYTDNGAPRKWLRTWDALPSGAPENIPMSWNSLQVFMQTGINVPSGTNPQVMLRWSDDGGYTWTGYFQMSAGQIGQTAWRVIQNRLGSTKIGTGLDRVWEISGTDPIPVKITSASADGGPS